jgi:hypothetical protein
MSVCHRPKETSFESEPNVVLVTTAADRFPSFQKRENEGTTLNPQQTTTTKRNRAPPHTIQRKQTKTLSTKPITSPSAERPVERKVHLSEKKPCLEQQTNRVVSVLQSGIS